MAAPTSIADLPGRIRLFPLGGAILLPRAVMPLNIFEPRYLEMVRDAMAGDRTIGIIQPRGDGQGDEPELFEVGGLGRITQFSETGDGRFLIALTGLIRFRITDELSVTTPWRQAMTSYAAFATDLSEPKDLEEPVRSSLETVLRQYLDAQDLSADWDAVSAAEDENLVNTLSVVSPFGAAERQALLEAPDLAARADTLTTLMRFAAGGTETGRA